MATVISGVDLVEEFGRPAHRDAFDILDVVGQGSFGKVFRGIAKETGTQVAIKQIKLSNSDESLADTLAEVRILRRCSSPYVCGFLK